MFIRIFSFFNFSFPFLYYSDITESSSFYFFILYIYDYFSSSFFVKSLISFYVCSFSSSSFSTLFYIYSFYSSSFSILFYSSVWLSFNYLISSSNFTVFYFKFLLFFFILSKLDCNSIFIYSYSFICYFNCSISSSLVLLTIFIDLKNIFFILIKKSLV